MRPACSSASRAKEPADVVLTSAAGIAHLVSAGTGRCEDRNGSRARRSRHRGSSGAAGARPQRLGGRARGTAVGDARRVHRSKWRRHIRSVDPEAFRAARHCATDERNRRPVENREGCRARRDIRRSNPWPDAGHRTDRREGRAVRRLSSGRGAGRQCVLRGGYRLRHGAQRRTLHPVSEEPRRCRGLPPRRAGIRPSSAPSANW